MMEFLPHSLPVGILSLLFDRYSARAHTQKDYVRM
jgi:hypothetical protein